jgi:hypothetical protein
VKPLIVFLPFLLDILLKLSALLVDPRAMTKAVEDLLHLPRPTNQTLELDNNQRSLIARVCSNASLRSVAILTCFISSCDAVLLLCQSISIVRLIALGLIFFLSGLLIIWLLSRDVLDLGDEVLWFRMEASTLLIIGLCLYDLVLGTIAIWAEAS